ncbi:MAG: DNA polymerase III subunit delta [Gemmatimonadaceae bacterium]
MLHTAIKNRIFDPVYFLFGDDDFLKEGASRDLVEAAVDPSTRDFNLEIRRANELDAEGLDALLSTPPMLAERRVVVLRDIDKLKKGARALLERYLARPAHDTVLVLVAPAGAKADKGLSDRATAVEFVPLTGERLPRWIVHHTKTALGRAITPEAVALLAEAVNSDLAQIAVELEKLASYTSGAIDERAVSDVVGVRRGESLGDFLDAVAARDARAALGLIPIVMQLPKTTAVSAIMALTTQTLAMAYGEAALASGVSQRNLFGELMTLLRETGAYPGRPWGEAVSAWAKHAPRWSAADLDRALSALLSADAALKETRLSSPEQLLTTLVLALCGGAVQRAA